MEAKKEQAKMKGTKYKRDRNPTVTSSSRSA